MCSFARISQKTGCGEDALHSRCTLLVVTELSARNGIFLAWFPKETKLQQPCSICQFPPPTFERWLLLKTFFFFCWGDTVPKHQTPISVRETGDWVEVETPLLLKSWTCCHLTPPPSNTPHAEEVLWMFNPCWTPDSPTTTQDTLLHQPQSLWAGMDAPQHSCHPAPPAQLLPLPWYNRVAVVRRRHPSCTGKAKQEE